MEIFTKVLGIAMTVMEIVVTVSLALSVIVGLVVVGREIFGDVRIPKEWKEDPTKKNRN